ncbi:MAG TPA: hypothetical protein VNO70_18705 [Blastocatellia bacterium]|nr:hypothetical protein [Blastocatellia bacterium]
MFRHRQYIIIAVTIAALFIFGCTPAPTNTNTGAAGNANTAVNTNANTGAPATGADAITTREPQDYSATMTVNAQTTGEAGNRTVPPLQFEFARRGDDRRWEFNLPQPVGEVAYLEKSGVKYLVIPSRKQYVELSPETLGFSLPNTMTPPAILDQLKARAQTQNLGTETVNGRPATKYKLTGSMDTRTQAGTAQTESVVYVDQSTGLPLRADIDATTTSGAGARVMIETRDIQLNPDPAQFEVPEGFRKVTAQELKQQVQNFVAALQVFVRIMQQQQAAPPGQPAQPTTNANRPPANANRPAANANR